MLMRDHLIVVSAFTIQFNLHHDFCLLDLKILIEIDGPHHIKKIAQWAVSGDKQQARDTTKTLYALHNGFHVIHVYEPDIKPNDADWKIEIMRCIRSCHNKEPGVFFISKDPTIYQNHIELLSYNNWFLHQQT